MLVMDVGVQLAPGHSPFAYIHEQAGQPGPLSGRCRLQLPATVVRRLVAGTETCGR